MGSQWVTVEHAGKEKDDFAMNEIDLKMRKLGEEALKRVYVREMMRYMRRRHRSWMKMLRGGKFPRGAGETIRKL